MRARLRQHPVACFLAITFAVTWGAWLSLALAGVTVGVGFAPVYLLGLVGPLVGALGTTAITDGRAGLRELLGRMLRVRVGLRWWAVALGLPIAAATTTYVALTFFSMFLLAPVELPAWRELGQFTGLPVTNAIAVFAMLLVINGFGEETGWRGFLLPALQRRWSPLTASLGVAGVWALWHAPAFLINASYRALPLAMIPMFIAGLVAGSVFLTWLYNKGRHSIALVAAWHAMFNLLSGTVAARGAVAAVETMVVVVLALVLLVGEVIAVRSGRPAQPLLVGRGA